MPSSMLACSKTLAASIEAAASHQNGPGQPKTIARMRFIPPLVAAALAAAAQQPVDEARLASARAAHAATDQLNEAVDALEQRQRARAHERRRLEQRKNEGAAHAAAISNKTEALWAELTKTKDLGDGRGPCDLASAGPDALTWARDALKDAAAVSKRLQGDRKAYLEAAQADLELLNRTVYPSLRAERDAIDLNLNDARARQKVLREDHAKSKTAWLRDQAKSFPLSLARSGAANWTAFRGAFNACAPILYGCRCHDDYDLFLCLCPGFLCVFVLPRVRWSVPRRTWTASCSTVVRQSHQHPR